jgi:hypothetical protein
MNMGKKKRFVKIGLLVIISIILIIGLGFFRYKTYNFPLNTLTEIKYYEPTDKKYAYHLLTLTPTTYYGFPYSQTVIAKAIYKDKKIGIKITVMADKLTFKSIGEESDNFVRAISELYDEKTDNRKMRPAIKSDFLWGSGFWSVQEGAYKTSITGLNGKQADLYLYVDIAKHTVEFGDRNFGLSKARFVNAFKNNE